MVGGEHEAINRDLLHMFITLAHFFDIILKQNVLTGRAILHRSHPPALDSSLRKSS